MRTLPAGLAGALKTSTPYVVLIGNADGGPDDATAQVLEYTLSGHSFTAKIELGTDALISGSQCRLRRGTSIAGVITAIDTSKFWIRSITTYETYTEVEASIFPQRYVTLAGDDTYQAVLTAFATAIGFTAAFNNAAAPFWGYQFLPTGRILTVNDARHILGLIKQKYLLEAMDAGAQVVRFYCVPNTDAIAAQVPNDQRLVAFGVQPYQVRRFIWRDEAGTTHQAGNAAHMVHNLGYLESTDDPPKTYLGVAATASEPEHLIVEPMNLTIESGDHFEYSGVLNPLLARTVEEYRRGASKTRPSWLTKIYHNEWFKTTEAGALPSTIEAAAPYTPLNVSHFDGILDASDNNIQAAMDTIDDHTHPASGGDISGTGVVGQVAEFVTNTKTIQAAKIIGPAANILTLTNAAAATLALNITAAKTLTLTAADNFALTVPATGTAALGVGAATGSQFAMTTYRIPFWTDANTLSSDATLLWGGYFGSPGVILPSLIVTGAAGLQFNAASAFFTGLGHLTFRAPAANSITFADNAATTITFGSGGGRIIIGPNVGSIPAAGVIGIYKGSTTTNAVLEVAKIVADVSTASTGSANGFGAGLAFDAETATNNTRATQALIAGSWIDATNATRKAKLSLFAYDTAARLGLEIEATGTVPKITLYGQTLISGGSDVQQLVVTSFTTQTLPPVTFIDNTAVTNAVRTVLNLETQSTGTAAAGLGAGLQFSIETATAGNIQPAALIAASLVNATLATYASKLAFWVLDNAGYTLPLELEADGAGAPKLAFYGGVTALQPSGDLISALAAVNLVSSPLLSHGSMYIYNLGAGAVTVTVAATDTFYEIGSGVSGGLCNGFTFQNSKELKCTKAGTYRIDWSLTVEVAAANQEIEGAVMKNGTAQTALASHAEGANSNRGFVIASTGIVALAANDLVSLSVLNHTATNNIVIDHLTLTLVRVA